MGGRSAGRPSIEPPPDDGRSQFLGAAAMIATCPSFYVYLSPAREVMVRQVPVAPVLCPACGEYLGKVEATGCPRMLSQTEALRMLMPPEILHAVPDS